MSFEEMYELALSRKKERPPNSSTTELFDKGTHAIGKKLLEEAGESWMAARYEGKEELSLELSQVLYYVACLMVDRGITPADVYKKL
jgi:phosphoribosyl-ATP pyrophosphohydrolase